MSYDPFKVDQYLSPFTAYDPVKVDDHLQKFAPPQSYDVSRIDSYLEDPSSKEPERDTIDKAPWWKRTSQIGPTKKSLGLGASITAATWTPIQKQLDWLWKKVDEAETPEAEAAAKKQFARASMAVQAGAGPGAAGLYPTSLRRAAAVGAEVAAPTPLDIAAFFTGKGAAAAVRGRKAISRGLLKKAEGTLSEVKPSRGPDVGRPSGRSGLLQEKTLKEKPGKAVDPKEIGLDEGWTSEARPDKSLRLSSGEKKLHLRPEGKHLDVSRLEGRGLGPELLDDVRSVADKKSLIPRSAGARLVDDKMVAMKGHPLSKGSRTLYQREIDAGRAHFDESGRLIFRPPGEAGVSPAVTALGQKAGRAILRTQDAAAEALGVAPYESGILRKAAHGKVLGAIRTARAEEAVAVTTARKWEAALGKGHEESLERIGAAVENTYHLKDPGKRKLTFGDLNPTERRVAKEYQKVQEEARKAVNEHIHGGPVKIAQDEYISYLENYVGHFYEGSKKQISQAVGRLMKHSPSAKKRMIPTLGEAADIGLVPKTQNVGKTYQEWSKINWRVATTRGLIKNLKDLHAPGLSAKGKPIPVILPPNHPDAVGWIKVDHPVFARVYKTEIAKKPGERVVGLWHGGVRVHPDVAKPLKLLLDDPFSNRFVTALETVNAVTKKSQLSFSLFHFTALVESAQAMLATVTNPIRSMILRRPGARGIGTTFKLGKELLEDPNWLRHAIGKGLQVGPASDIQLGRVARLFEAAEKKTRSIPWVRGAVRGARKANEKFDRALWEFFHARLKAVTFYDAEAKMLKIFGDKYGPQELGERVARAVNNAYGSQEWAAKLILGQPKMKQVLNWAILAPDWTLSNINVAKGIFPGIMESIKVGAVTPEVRLYGRYWASMLTTLYASHAILQAAIHKTFGDSKKGDQPFMWDNEVGNRSTVDVTPLYRALGLKEADKQRYYAKAGKQAREVLGMIENPLEALKRKASPVASWAMEQLSGEESGGFSTEWKAEGLGFWESIPSRVKATALKPIPFSFRGNNFAFALPLRKGMTNWKAREAYARVLDAYANPSLVKWAVAGYPTPPTNDDKAIAKLTKDLERLSPEITDAARRNGLDPEVPFKRALSEMRRKYYGRFLRAIQDGNEKNIEKTAIAVIRLNGAAKNLLQSAQERPEIELTPEMRKTIRRMLRGRSLLELYDER